MRSKKPPHDRKRVRTEIHVPTRSNPVHSLFKFLVMASELESKPFSKLSPLLVAKTLEGMIGKNHQAIKLQSGDLLIELEWKYQSEVFLTLSKIVDYKVSISPHRCLNTCREVISEDDLLDVSQKRMLDGLQDQCC